MYYLDQKNHELHIILLSGIFVTIILVLHIAFCFDSSLVFIYVSIPFIVLYVVLTLLSFKCSKNKKTYLMLQENEMQIRYFDYRKGKFSDLNLLYTDIECISYSKICSKSTFKDFLFFILLLLPTMASSYNVTSFGLKSVCIIYRIGLIKKKVMIGYLDYKDVKKICEEKNIKLEV